MNNWHIPLAFIPSIAVIITSTSRLALGLTDELNNKMKEKELYATIIEAKIKQLKRLSIAGVMLYISLAILVSDVLLVALTIIPEGCEFYGVIASVFFFQIAIIFLIIFSVKAFLIRQKQFKI